jgi:dTDP-4-amino-4,6-dideoxygalactose transaminase
MKVPFNDLTLHHRSIRDELDNLFDEVITNSQFIRGKHVEDFESTFASLIGLKHCVSCGNGTDALYIAIKSLDIKPGDEVIVPAHSWISTSEIVTQAGGKVIFCDTNMDTFTIDTKKIAEKITKRTVGIIPVHLYGHPADMDEILRIAKEHGLWIIEDCAQAVLSEYKGKKIGTFGDISTFSFYPGKNLGAIGDAGAILTNDENLKHKMACFARHGGLIKGSHEIEGINSRMDALQAGVLNIKLKHIEMWTLKRQEVAKKYLTQISDLRYVTLPKIKKACSHVWHLFVIQIEDRDGLKDHLYKNGVQTIINYPVCLPLLPAYKYLDHSKFDFPTAYHHQSRILSLPIFPEITNEQIDFVVSNIKSFYG